MIFNSSKGVKMGLITWDDSYSVNIAEIDRQHQKLIGMFAELNDAMSKGQGKEAIGKVLNELVSYTIQHFRTEEKLFDQYGYPDAENHKEKHSEFTRKVDGFKKDFDSGKLGLSIEVLNFLSDWLRDHIMGVDKKYAPFLIEKGVS